MVNPGVIYLCKLSIYTLFLLSFLVTVLALRMRQVYVINSIFLVNLRDKGHGFDCTKDNHDSGNVKKIHYLL